MLIVTLGNFQWMNSVIVLNIFYLPQLGCSCNNYHRPLTQWLDWLQCSSVCMYIFISGVDSQSRGKLPLLFDAPLQLKRFVCYRYIFQWEQKHIYLHLMAFLNRYDTGSWNPSLSKTMTYIYYILYSQYHGCWCPGYERSQGISSHDIDLVKPR